MNEIPKKNKEHWNSIGHTVERWSDGRFINQYENKKGTIYFYSYWLLAGFIHCLGRFHQIEGARQAFKETSSTILLDKTPGVGRVDQ